MVSLALLRPLRGPGFSAARRATTFVRDLIDRFFSLLDESERVSRNPNQTAQAPSPWILYAR